MFSLDKNSNLDFVVFCVFQDEKRRNSQLKSDMQRMRREFDAKFSENQQKSAEKCESLAGKLSAVTSSYKELSHVTRKANEKLRKLDVESVAQAQRIRSLLSENEALNAENVRLKAEVDGLAAQLKQVLTLQAKLKMDSNNGKVRIESQSQTVDCESEEALLERIHLQFEQLSDAVYSGVQYVSKPGAGPRQNIASDGEQVQHDSSDGLRQLSTLCEKLRKISTTKVPPAPTDSAISGGESGETSRSQDNDGVEKTAANCESMVDPTTTRAAVPSRTGSCSKKESDKKPVAAPLPESSRSAKDLLKPSDQPETPTKESVTSTVDGPIWGRRTAIVGSPGDVIQLQQLALKTRDASDKKISIKRKITRKLSRNDENR